MYDGAKKELKARTSHSQRKVWDSPAVFFKRNHLKKITMLSEQLKFDIERMNLEGLAALREQKCQALEIAEIKRKTNDFSLEAMKKRVEIYTEKLKELEVAAERKKIRCEELTEQIAYISEKIATF